jgi:hypothetical protein
MAREAIKNKEKLIAHVKGQNIECYGDNTILGMSLTTFLIVIILVAIPWIIAAYLLVTRFHKLESWAIVVSIISLMTGLGSTVAIIAILMGEKKGSKKGVVNKLNLRSSHKTKNTTPLNSMRKISKRYSPRSKKSDLFRVVKGTW